MALCAHTESCIIISVRDFVVVVVVENCTCTCLYLTTPTPAFILYWFYAFTVSREALLLCANFYLSFALFWRWIIFILLVPSLVFFCFHSAFSTFAFFCVCLRGFNLTFSTCSASINVLLVFPLALAFSFFFLAYQAKPWVMPGV